MSSNSDYKTIESFGDEWSTFSQEHMDGAEIRRIFGDYFKIFPWDLLPKEAVGFDMGCGSGRWAALVAPRVKELYCIEPSSAIRVAQRRLSERNNVRFIRGTTDKNGLASSSFDFGYSLGVLHHLPDPASGIKDCVRLLKPGAPMLIYFYYNLENRNFVYRGIWRLTDLTRMAISRLPLRRRTIITNIIAISIYYPISRMARLVELLGLPFSSIPLAYYKDCSLKTLMTDARDRFGTPLEHRYSSLQLFEACRKAGLKRIRFSDSAPYWCVVGFKE